MEASELKIQRQQPSGTAVAMADCPNGLPWENNMPPLERKHHFSTVYLGRDTSLKFNIDTKNDGLGNVYPH